MQLLKVWKITKVFFRLDKLAIIWMEIIILILIKFKLKTKSNAFN